MEIKIEYVPIEELKTYPNNAKIHTAEQIEQIKESIKEFGMNDPIAVWKDNVIIEGHGRLIACVELGIKKVPVIDLGFLTDEQRKAYGIIHNQLTMNSGFDFDVLICELDEITGIDMKKYGFVYDEGKEFVIEEKEYPVDVFGDEQFEYECGKCGFKFNA